MSYMKLILRVAVIIIALICIKLAYKAGYKAHALEVMEATQKERVTMIAEHEAELLVAIADAEIWREKAEKAQAELNISTNEVMKHVNKVKKTSNCVNLGSDFRSMHNKTADRFSARIGSTR